MTASSSKPEPPKVMSSYHRHRACGCFICDKQQTRYDHFRVLSNGEKRFIKQHAHSDIPEDSCLCRAHHMEAKHHQCDPEYIPIRGKKGIKGHSILQNVLFLNVMLPP